MFPIRKSGIVCNRLAAVDIATGSRDTRDHGLNRLENEKPVREHVHV